MNSPAAEGDRRDLSRSRSAGLGEELRELRRSGKITSVHTVFTLQDGSPLTKAVLRGMFERTVERCEAIPAEKKSGEDKVTFHTLRHTAASLMAQKGVSLFEIAKILGHSSIAMTMRYAHFAPDEGKAAVDVLGEILAGPEQASAAGSEGP